MSNGKTLSYSPTENHGSVASFDAGVEIKRLRQSAQKCGEATFDTVFRGIERGPSHEFIGMRSLLYDRDLTVGEM